MFRARRIRRRRAIARSAAIGGAEPVQEQRAGETQGEAPAPESGTDRVEQIKELAELRDQGILTEEEFAAEKKKLLES